MSSIIIIKGKTKTNTSQKYCASASPTSFTDPLLYMTSLLEFSTNPRQQEPTTRQTPSGLLPPLICSNSLLYDLQKKNIYGRKFSKILKSKESDLLHNWGEVPHGINYEM